MPFRVSWGALFAGAAASVGMLILLYALGLALGMTTASAGIFTGAWSLVAPIAALFIGGMVAGRSAGATSRLGGALHGMVVWSIAAVASAYLVANVFGGLLGSAVAVNQVGQHVASQAAAAVDVEPTQGAAMWIIFGALCLGFLASLCGGAAGVTREQRHMAELGAGATAPEPAVEVAMTDDSTLRQEIADLRAELHEMRHH
jgi:hypothetical protein